MKTPIPQNRSYPQSEMEIWFPYLRELEQTDSTRLCMLLNVGSPLWVWYTARVNPRMGFRLAVQMLNTRGYWPVETDSNIHVLDSLINAFIKREEIAQQSSMPLLSRALMSNDYGEENDSRCLGYVYSRLSDGLDYSLRARKIAGWHPGTANYIYLGMHAFTVGRRARSIGDNNG